MQRRAVGGELPAELRVGGDVAPLGERGEPGRVPGPGGEPAVHGLVEVAEDAGKQRCYLFLLTAHGRDGGSDQVGVGGDGGHLVGGGDIGCLPGGGECLVPASAIGAGPFQA